MQQEKIYRYIRIAATVQILFSLLVIGIFLWIVEAAPASAVLQEFVAGMKSAAVGDGAYTYETAGFISAFPLVLIALSVWTIIVLKKKAKKWMRVTFIVNTAFALLGVLFGTFPIFQITIAGLFFALYRQEEKSKEKKSQDE